MSELKVLYIDDDEGDREAGAGLELKEALTTCYKTSELLFKAVDFRIGKELIEADPDGFHLFIVDILEEHGDKSRDTGLGLIGLLSRTSSQAVIGISQDPELLPSAEGRGAHATLTKGQVSRHKEYVPTKLAAAFEQANVIPPLARPAALDRNEESLPLEATIEQVGETELGVIISRLCREQPDSIKLGYVRAGLSGSLVLRCSCSVPEDQDEEFLLKLSRDEQAARTELKAWQELGRASLYPQLLTTELAEAHGWYGMAIDFREGSTLSDWLTESQPDPAQVAEELGRILPDGGLVAQYAGSLRPKSKGPAAMMHEHTLTLGRRARILLARNAMLRLSDRHLPNRGSLGEPIELFIRHGHLPGRSPESLPSQSCTVNVHGDLHGRNIVIGQQRAVLIDPSRKLPGHPAIDWARLTVDVLLTGFAHPPESFEWGRSGEWLTLTGSFVRGDGELATDLMPSASVAAANWLRDNAQSIFEPLGGYAPEEWELRLALAVELLRAVPREALPMPIRVLALRAAADALDAAAAGAPEETPT